MYIMIKSSPSEFYVSGDLRKSLPLDFSLCVDLRKSPPRKIPLGGD